MLPTKARKSDWNLYYNRTWMNHVKHGPCYIRVGDGTFRGHRLLESGQLSERGVTCLAKDLAPWWPRSGAFNGDLGAVYITRRAQRNMRK